MSAYGCFTTVRVEPGGVRGWARHLGRLVHDSAELFDRSVTEAEVVTAVRGALVGVERPVLLRIAVTARDHRLARPGGVDLSVEAAPRPAHRDPTPLRIVTTPHRRALPAVKHLGLAPDLAVRRRAQRAGFDDALFVDADLVTEGPTWSLIARLGDRLVSPTGGLPGVTAALLAQVRPLDRRVLTVGELADVSAAVAVNAGWGVRPIASIDGRVLADASPTGLAGELAAAYDEIVPEPL